jgi:NAD(P)-dependent dehydrogenase (short-subunit alcohol dehydrogenase family)
MCIAPCNVHGLPIRRRIPYLPFTGSADTPVCLVVSKNDAEIARHVNSFDFILNTVAAAQSTTLRSMRDQKEQTMNPTYNFKGQVALVTGAGSGMGLATARAFAVAGAAVVLADINKEALAAATDALLSAGHRALAVTCDVSDETEAAAMVVRAVTTFGRLDMAFNNAGIQGSGAIVNCSSLGGLVGLPNRAAYHASKHGVIGLTRSAAMEYAPRGIRINAVCPGTIATPMVTEMLKTQADAIKEIMREQPIGRLGQSEEIAAAVLWLCSPGASFVLGVALPVDGGFTAH